MSEAAPKGAMTRARRSVEAIRTIAAMRRHGRDLPTDPERDILLGWSGWGPLAPLFAPPNQSWLDLSTEVQGLITAEEFAMGKAATYNAFYTPDHLATAMWSLLTDIGFDGGTVLEPGCGGGVFFRTAPAGVKMLGVERDPITAAITGALHPDHRVVNDPLERAQLTGGYAAAIGNVPFGNVPVHDATAPPAVRASLHNYFLHRTLTELAPGGVAVLLTSRWTMDAQGAEVRSAIGDLADFLGAVRLPNGGLGGGTEALADVVVLRRRGDRDIEPSEMDGWLAARAVVSGVSVNKYWDNRPDMILGKMDLGKTSRWGLGIQVDGDLPALPGQFTDACSTLAKRITDRDAGCTPAVDPTVLDTGGIDPATAWWDGQFRWVNGVLQQMKPAKRATKTTPAVPRRVERINRPSDELVRLIRLRDLARDLVRLESDHDRPDADITPVRDAARTEYEAYLAKYGPVNRSKIVKDKPDPAAVAEWRASEQAAREAVAESLGLDPADVNLDDYDGVREALGLGDGPEETFTLVPERLGGFRNDPDFPLVAALEVYDNDTGEHKPAPILAERQNRRVERPTSTGDPMQALAWSLDRLGGRVDVGYVADALGKSRIEAIAMLGDRIFRDPTTAGWVPADEYLSGQVRQKLRFAEAAAADDPEYTRNVTALQQVQPRWLGAADIHAKLGAAWIPAEVIRQFVVDLLEDGESYSGVEVKHLDAGNKWEVKGGHRLSNEARIQWGTPDRPGHHLIEDGLNSRVPVIKVPVDNGDGTERMVKDVDKSSVAVAKLQEIQARFADWIWEDAGRVADLVPKYNEVYNSLVPRTFDGSHITIDGLAPWAAEKAYPHQWDFVARAVGTPASLCGHPVGAGKTWTMAMVIMKLRQLGLSGAGMMAVPKHLLEQTERQVRQLFPAAKILAVSTESISRNRREFAARCATQDWDIVIITHPAFDKIRVWEGTEADYIAAQKQVLDASIRRTSRSGELESGMVKTAAKAADRLESRIRYLRDRAVARDPGAVTFEQLKIRLLAVDEAHGYKNLALACNIDGFSVRPSKRATDLDMKLWWLSQQTGGQPYAALFTGTPVSNTMLELYVILQYLMRDSLAAMGLGSADAWAGTFVEMVTSVDVTVDGGNFTLKTRPARFVNAPELRLLLSMCAHICTKQQLGLPGPEVVVHVETCPPTTAQGIYSTELVARAEAVKGQSRFSADAKKDNMLKICTDGRRMATDPALVGIDDPEPGKLARIAANVLKVWRKHPNTLQIIFSDIGTPNPKKGDQTYGRIRDLLIAGGMPAGQIEFVHNHQTGTAKVSLFGRCRKDGGISVLMGSTDKLGVGTNIQRRLKAIHHADAPFRPSDDEQRIGRGDRPGNLNDVLLVFRYVTMRTFDAYMWQMLTRKAGFITQILSGVLDRSVEDVTADIVLSFAAIKAAATDQPLLIERAELEAEVKQLAAQHRAWRIGQTTMQAQIDAEPAVVAGYEADIARWQQIADGYTGGLTEADVAGLTAMAEDPHFYRTLTIAGLRVDRARGQDLAGKDHPIMVINGERWGRNGERVHLATFHKPDKWIEEFTRVAGRAAGQVRRWQSLLEEYVAETVKTRKMAGEPFAKQDELNAKTARLEEIEVELREAATPDRVEIASDRDLAAAAEAEQIRAAQAPRPAEVAAGPVVISQAWIDDLFKDPSVNTLVTDDLDALLAAL